jgi:hypothetical protein
MMQGRSPVRWAASTKTEKQPYAREIAGADRQLREKLKKQPHAKAIACAAERPLRDPDGPPDIRRPSEAMGLMPLCFPQIGPFRRPGLVLFSRIPRVEGRPKAPEPPQPAWERPPSPRLWRACRRPAEAQRRREAECGGVPPIKSPRISLRSIRATATTATAMPISK